VNEQQKHMTLDKRGAEALAKRIEKEAPTLRVTGIRHYEAEGTYGVDVEDTISGYPATYYTVADWDEHQEEQARAANYRVPNYDFGWDACMGTITPEQVVADCRDQAQSFEDFADEYAHGEFVENWRRTEERFVNMTDPQWAEHTAALEAWIVDTLVKTAAEMDKGA